MTTLIGIGAHVYSNPVMGGGEGGELVPGLLETTSDDPLLETTTDDPLTES